MPMRRYDIFLDIAAVVVALFWVGMLAGVSFLATPVKFQAVSLSLPVALEVGKVTFGAFSKIEWLLAVLLAIQLFSFRTSTMTLVSAVIAIVALQALWLLPVLDARVDAVIAGTPLTPTWHHLLYAVSEGGKLVLLCVIALAALCRLGQRQSYRYSEA